MRGASWLCVYPLALQGYQRCGSMAMSRKLASQNRVRKDPAPEPRVVPVPDLCLLALQSYDAALEPAQSRLMQIKRSASQN